MNSLTALLYMVMAWQQQTVTARTTGTTIALYHYNLNANRKDCTPLWVDKLHSDWSIGFDAKWCYIEIAPPPPFDVPPVEIEHDHYEFKIDSVDRYYLQGAREGCGMLSTANVNVQCREKDGWFYRVEKEKSCKDKYRFLLMSEDGKWHCLALGQKP
jgi:hypothetical protein